MKKKVIIGLSLLLIITISIGTVFLFNKKTKPFYLENDYYGTSKMTEINIAELNQLIEDELSFAVFVYQPMCVTSADFESVLSDFLEENSITIYKIPFASIKDTEIGKSVKYYPSFIIYNKGKIVDFLEADKDEDVNYYTKKDSFYNWFTKYVKLKDNIPRDDKSIINESSKNENNTQKDISIENVVKEDNKVNIYFFWGNGCPHCEEEFEFFESIQDEYKDRYNLYTFETWYNEENAKLMLTFADAMEEEVKGVPFTIIGDKFFKGFSKRIQKDIISAIESQSNYDVYFDKIKKP